MAHRVVHDLRSGSGGGQQSTGHALAPGATGGPAPHEPGAGRRRRGRRGRALRAGRARRVRDAPLVRATSCGPKESLVTAVTRDGTFLIEDGHITRPAHDLRLTDSVLGILSRMEALGARQELVGEAEFYGRRFATAVACPPLRASDVRFTGSAAGSRRPRS